jgi:hypothetical protein
MEGVCGGNLGKLLHPLDSRCIVTNLVCLSSAFSSSAHSRLSPLVGFLSALALPECATCHLYIPASFPASPPTPDEEDMLGYAIGHRPSESRLGCQISVSEEIGKWAEEGGVIGLPRF